MAKEDETDTIGTECHFGTKLSGRWGGTPIPVDTGGDIVTGNSI